MTTALLLLLSAALIVTGVALVRRDVQRSRRDPFLVRADATAVHPDVEVTVSRPDQDPPLPRNAATLPGTGDATELPAQWAALKPVIAAAVDRVNAVLAGAGVAIGASGEPSWSMMKRGYGVHRRILVAGDSVAWLRLELDADSHLQAGVKAHKDNLSEVNSNAAAPARGLDDARASDLLSECLKPAASFAMRSTGGGGTAQWASETAWKEIDALVAASLRAANGALAQAGARFLPIAAPAWTGDVGRHRLTVNVEVLSTNVARMLIERIGEEIEVAIGLPDPHLANLGRRQRIALRGLTTHALAELIASCAWPAIAHFRETQATA